MVQAHRSDNHPDFHIGVHGDAEMSGVNADGVELEYPLLYDEVQPCSKLQRVW
jgi:hypothetical protein